MATLGRTTARPVALVSGLLLAGAIAAFVVVRVIRVEPPVVDPPPVTVPVGTPTPAPTPTPALSDEWLEWPPVEKRVTIVGLDCTRGYPSDLRARVIRDAVEVVPRLVKSRSPGHTIIIRCLSVESYSDTNHLLKIFVPPVPKLRPAPRDPDLRQCDLLPNVLDRGPCRQQLLKAYRSALDVREPTRLWLERFEAEATDAVRVQAARLGQLELPAEDQGPPEVLGFFRRSSEIVRELEGSSRNIVLFSILPLAPSSVSGPRLDLTAAFVRFFKICRGGAAACQDAQDALDELLRRAGACEARFIPGEIEFDAEVFAPRCHWPS